ncbi:glycoside hydrolase family 53 protein [Cohnella thailandensis]|uniref:Arabinogalactan endo-beta-1,4-galactanase n=1 Tax=Cohnella thailandensis TaxID=557557 RepID=A0A841T0D5_9BACL|nr:glycosyl hydrolase 53 family protein [Cohnella thailandensis]MBB6636549.1 glycosyl hydrolase 53 family protein [Cohnella thailandensis]MBP1977578.1 arabinogalactan endo-1,4-beta-galactosidase [Cohnella thailandensis]
MAFIKGMDISVQTEIEQLGAQYYNDGEEGDAVQILGDYNVNHIRLRLWNDPYDADNKPYGGGTNDLTTTIKLAQRAARRGMGFLLDLHYSDFWADPGTQVKPKAWQDLSGEALERAVYHYTFDTLKELDRNGVLPGMIQIGNEITNGLLWSDGRFENSTAMFRLLAAGIEGVRDYNPAIRIVIHLDWGGDNSLYRRWFDTAAAAELDFDIIGLSYYPFWHGTLEQLTHNMNDISSRYGKDVLIAETAFPFTTEKIKSEAMIFTEEHAASVPYTIDEKGQSRFMLDLMSAIRSVENNRGIGFFYWEPTWLNIREARWATEEGKKYLSNDGISANVWANLALFDFRGNALPALQAIRDF